MHHRNLFLDVCIITSYTEPVKEECYMYFDETCMRHWFNRLQGLNTGTKIGQYKLILQFQI